jgi:transposase-like protein
MFAAEIRNNRVAHLRHFPQWRWHLDEVFVKINGKLCYLWRAVDAEGEVLDVLVQSKRSKHAALELMRKLLRKYAVVPERLVTDDLRSYGAATLELTCMIAGDGKIIGPRIRISRPDAGSARCNASRARAQRRSSSQPTPPPSNRA